MVASNNSMGVLSNNLEDTAVYLLKFQSPAHFGEDSSGLARAVEFYHSDSLYNAICRAWATIYGSSSLQNELLEPSLAYSEGKSDTVPLLLSSAFVFAGERFYLPKPQMDLIPQDRGFFANEPQLAKTLKKTQFISNDLWQRWVNGKDLTQFTKEKLEESFQSYGDYFEFNLSTRSYVRRNGGDTVPYPCRSVVFKQRAGLYFFAKFDHANKAKLQECFNVALNYLQDAGLGGERSSGYGVFRYEQLASESAVTDILGQPESDKVGGYIALSLASPDHSDFLANWHYSLIRRRGYTSPAGGTDNNGEQSRWRGLLMLGEGSSQNSANAPRGQFHNVTPSEKWKASYNKVYRCGLALTWPCTTTD